MSKHQDDTLLEELLAAIQATFGHHPGYRATHARGIVAHGTFTAAPEAARLSRAAHLQGQEVPVTLRFSNFSGVPQTPDGDVMASPRGLGIRFHAGEGAGTDIVAHSFDGFPVATPREFLAFLQGIAASVSATTPDAAPLEQFLAAHPRARHYLETVKPAPRSYTSIPYFGINAFVLAAADGTLSTGRYRIEPLLPPETIPDQEVPSLPDNYLADELAARLARGPAAMRLVFQLAGDADDTADGSVPWPHEGPDARREQVLGTLQIEALAIDQAQASRELAFDPARLLDGLQLSNDPMVPLRSAFYRFAASHRR